LVFWQADLEGLESSSIDGAPLALLPTSGGDPVVARNSVLIYPDQLSLTGKDLGWLALVTGGGRETWTNKGLSLMGPKVTGNLAPAGQVVSSPSWSPDASRVAFSAMPDAGHVWAGPEAEAALMQRRLWVVDVSSGELQQLTHEAAFRDEFPHWSRDGRTLLFVRLDIEGNVSLWQMDAQGGDPFMLVYGLSPDDLGQETDEAYGHIAWYDVFDWDQ
jgi:dipeptidyl aminopeptidase/acylaminoacyl peptidase